MHLCLFPLPVSYGAFDVYSTITLYRERRHVTAPLPLPTVVHTLSYLCWPVSNPCHTRRTPTKRTVSCSCSCSKVLFLFYFSFDTPLQHFGCCFTTCGCEPALVKLVVPLNWSAKRSIHFSCVVILPHSCPMCDRGSS